MAREETITAEQVAAAAEALKAEGIKPTTRSVREYLGAGSMATVLKYLQQWKAGQTRQTQAIDDTIDPSIARAISNQLAARVQEATAETTARLADLQAEIETVIAENERQAAEIEAQAIALSELQEQLAATTGRAQQLEADAARQASELAAERAAAETARVELAKADLRLEAVPRIEAEIVKVREELLQARKEAADLHEVAAVAGAKLEAENAQRKKLEAQLAEEIKRSEVTASRALEFSEVLGNERVAVQTTKAKLESTLRDLEESRLAASKAQESAQKAMEEAAELRGQLAATQPGKKPAPQRRQQRPAAGKKKTS